MERGKRRARRGVESNERVRKTSARARLMPHSRFFLFGCPWEAGVPSTRASSPRRTRTAVRPAGAQRCITPARPGFSPFPPLSFLMADGNHRELAAYVAAALAGAADPAGLRGRLARARPALLDLLRVPVRWCFEVSKAKKNARARARDGDACVFSHGGNRSLRLPSPTHAHAPPAERRRGSIALISIQTHTISPKNS